MSNLDKKETKINVKIKKKRNSSLEIYSREIKKLYYKYICI